MKPAGPWPFEHAASCIVFEKIFRQLWGHVGGVNESDWNKEVSSLPELRRDDDLSVDSSITDLSEISSMTHPEICDDDLPAAVPSVVVDLFLPVVDGAVDDLYPLEQRPPGPSLLLRPEYA